MPYTGDPSNIPADAVRFHAGDTDNDNLLLSDNEVLFALTQMSDPRLAAALCCDSLGAKYTRKADVSVGEISTSYGDRAKAFREQADRLRDEAGKFAVPFFGGQSQADKVALSQNLDAVATPFSVQQFDNPLSRQFDGKPADPSDPSESGS